MPSKAWPPSPTSHHRPRPRPDQGDSPDGSRGHLNPPRRCRRAVGASLRLHRLYRRRGDAGPRGYHACEESWDEAVLDLAGAPPPYGPDRAIPVYMASNVAAEHEVWRFVSDE